MATSGVKAGLDAVAKNIANLTSRVEGALEALSGIEADLTSIPTTYADVIAEVDGFTPTGEFESLAQDELAKLTTEFLALKAKVVAAEAELA